MGDLRLVAQQVVAGFLAGQHRDARPGEGADFSQYRAYEPGDDPRRVDWRVYARSDRFYVREAEVERDVVVRFLLDASASMDHADGGLSKLAYGGLLIACLAHLAERQGDRIAFHAVTDAPTAVDLPAAGVRRGLPRLVGVLETLTAAGTWPRWETLWPRLAARRGRELTVVVSDLHDREGGIDTTLAALRARGHEVLLLHLMGRDELDFTYQGDLLFEDLESGETVRANAAELRSAYLARLARHLETWRERLLELGVDAHRITLDTPPARTLRSFLLRRRRLPRP